MTKPSTPDYSSTERDKAWEKWFISMENATKEDGNQTIRVERESGFKKIHGLTKLSIMISDPEFKKFLMREKLKCLRRVQLVMTSFSSKGKRSRFS